ncbi:hypothetical protein LEL_01534 [Akanthomyces lecanii RCEF 1005]|uniref:Uncharacterized protein n=1 Tax=Akanthomyces lecanii RCEF 1005 TaxID=1081108 RepID=A0A168KPZ3_CORDF|nr:hypothetical protein LEL_01534 [Akanthomyces lecanii RCEF 1005]
MYDPPRRIADAQGPHKSVLQRLTGAWTSGPGFSDISFPNVDRPIAEPTYRNDDMMCFVKYSTAAAIKLPFGASIKAALEEFHSLNDMSRKWHELQRWSRL